MKPLDLLIGRSGIYPSPFLFHSLSILYPVLLPENALEDLRSVRQRLSSTNKVSATVLSTATNRNRTGKHQLKWEAK